MGEYGLPNQYSMFRSRPVVPLTIAFGKVASLSRALLQPFAIFLDRSGSMLLNLLQRLPQNIPPTN